MNRVDKLLDKIKDVYNDIEEYIISNKEWIYYFINPSLDSNKELLNFVKEHPDNWGDYIELTIVDVTSNSVRVNLIVEDYDIKLIRYISLPTFDIGVERNKKIYDGELNEIRIKNLKDEIGRLNVLLENRKKLLKELEEEKV